MSHASGVGELRWMWHESVRHMGLLGCLVKFRSPRFLSMIAMTRQMGAIEYVGCGRSCGNFDVSPLKAGMARN